VRSWNKTINELEPSAPRLRAVSASNDSVASKAGYVRNVIHIIVSRSTHMLQQLRPAAALSFSAVEALRVERLGHNHLLAALPPADLEILAPHLAETMLDSGNVLQEPSQPIARVYFLHGGLVSLLSALPEGHDIESASIGREGAIGLQAGLGAEKGTSRAVVRFGTRAASISAGRFAELAADSKAMREMIARHNNVLLAQVQQLLACNTMHCAEERLCRWLANARDRVGHDVLPVTQELLANLLGLRRTTVTMIAHMLHNQGAINVRRGRIQICDVAALERKACPCSRALHGLNAASSPGSTS
jgi:CRP-like cAMP-binding protein